MVIGNLVNNDSVIEYFNYQVRVNVTNAERLDNNGCSVGNQYDLTLEFRLIHKIFFKLNRFRWNLL